MIFHADSESDLKTSPNQLKNPILSKIQFLSYFDLKNRNSFVLGLFKNTRVVGFDAASSTFQSGAASGRVAAS